MQRIGPLLLLALLASPLAAAVAGGNACPLPAEEVPLVPAAEPQDARLPA